MTIGKEKIELSRLLKALGSLRQFYPPGMERDLQVSALEAFLYVAAHDDQQECPLERIGKDLGIHAATLSRYIAALSHWGQTGKKTPGLDWVLSAERPQNRRAKIVMLTPKGRQVVTALLHALTQGETHEHST